MMNTRRQTQMMTAVHLPGDGATVTRNLPSLPQAMQAIASGPWVMTEHRLPPMYAGLRPHAHSQFDMVIYVTEGEPTFQVGEQVVQASVGQWVMVSRGMVHTWFNTRPEPARFMVFCLGGDVTGMLCEPGQTTPGAS